MKHEWVRMREQQTVPSWLADTLDFVDRFGLTVTDFQTNRDDGTWEKEYHVTAYHQERGSTSQIFIAGARYDPFGAPVFGMHRFFTPNDVAMLMDQAQFRRRLQRIAKTITGYGVALDEVNDVLHFSGIQRRDMRTNKYTRAFSSYKMAVAVHRLDMSWALKETLLRFHCSPGELLACEGMAESVIRELFQLPDNNF